MPTPLQSYGAVVNGILYVPGGESGGYCVSTVEAYNPTNNTWSTKSSMPTARCHTAVVACNGIIYVLGGTDTDGYFEYNNVEAYDPATDTWSVRSPMPTARRHLAASAVNGLIYAIGGDDGTKDLTTVEVYDPVADTWTSGLSLPEPRAQNGQGVLDETISVAGGETTFDSASLLSVEGLVVQAVSWSSSNTNVASIDSNGLATASGIGTNLIVATYNGLTGSACLTVTNSLPYIPVSSHRGGAFQFTFTGPVGTTNIFQATTNLVTWYDLATIVNTNGAIYFTDPSATNTQQKFYRVMILQ
jgi:hypothetical protein